MSSLPTITTPIPALVVGADALTFDQLRLLVADSELVLISATADEATTISGEDFDGRVIVGTDWPSEQALMQFCHAIRQRFGARTRIAAIAGLPQHSPNFYSGAFGVDAIVQRPIGPNMLFQLRQAFGQDPVDYRPRDVKAELKRALDDGSTGELVVRSGSASAMIFIEEGHIVWALLSTMPTSLHEVLQYAGLSLDEETLRAVVDESQRKGVHFIEVLVSWGLLSDTSGRDAVRLHVSDRVRMILSLPNPVAMFLPKKRRKQERFRFRSNELFRSGDLRPRQSDGALLEIDAAREKELPTMDAINATLAEVMATEGVVGAAIVSRQTGASLAHGGTHIDANVLWSEYALISTLASGARDVMATTDEHCYLMRPLGSVPQLLLFTVISLEQSSLGLARTSLARIDLR
ncbi:MAG: hypothetical protein JNK05_30320 [Myxococcales bacterium]|nr:hypothetical protein [Myxococcales bacterium]